MARSCGSPPGLHALSILAAALFLAGCLDPIDAGTLTPGEGTVRGTVRRWCGAQPALAGAQISVDGVVRAHTDADGAYRVDGVTAGRAHVMAADLPGYVHTETLVRAPAGAVKEQNFILETPGDSTTPVLLDVLFVIDNTATMAGRQAVLAAAFPAMAARLESASLNLHLGIITTDVGAGAFAPPSCDTLGGDDGLLQLQPRGATCDRAAALPYAGLRYLGLVRDAGGTTSASYTGSLADAFACYAPVGTEGCGFPMPLEALRLALDPTQTENGDFLRDGATLLVVIVTDGDDCSAPPDSGLFDPFQTDPTSLLGPLTSYRCFEFGATCGGQPPGRAAGSRADCHAGEPDSRYPLQPLDRYFDLLTTTHGGRVVLGVLAGPPDDVEVVTDADGFPRLVPSCQRSGDSATPAIRLADLTAALLAGNSESICGATGTIGAALDAWAQQALALAVAARSCGE
jgi:hypothetical protein